MLSGQAACRDCPDTADQPVGLDRERAPSLLRDVESSSFHNSHLFLQIIQHSMDRHLNRPFGLTNNLTNFQISQSRGIAEPQQLSFIFLKQFQQPDETSNLLSMLNVV